MDSINISEKFAIELLAAATDFDFAALDNPEDTTDSRTQVLKHFVEQYLERKISNETAARINYLTQYPGECESQDLAPVLAELLDINSFNL